MLNSSDSVSRSQDSSPSVDPPILNIPLKAAIEEVRVLKIKIEGEGGIAAKEYGEDIADLVNIVDKAYGDSKILEAVKSSLEGHQLALEFWQCDRASGFDEMHQCRDKVLKKIFAKYPDIAVAVKAAVEGENVPYISAGLDKDALLQAIWQEIGKDTDVAVLAANPELHSTDLAANPQPSPNETLPQ